MSRRSERATLNRIDYKLFGTTGERLSPTETMPDDFNETLDNESVLSDEIADLIEENDPHSIRSSPELMLNSIKKIEALRMQYRAQHRLIKRKLGDDEYEEKFAKINQQVLSSVSAYIKEINQIYQSETNATKVVSVQKSSFLEKEKK